MHLVSTSGDFLVCFNYVILAARILVCQIMLPVNSARNVTHHSNQTDETPANLTTELQKAQNHCLSNPTNVTCDTPRPWSERTPIYLGGFFSHGGTWDSSGILPAVEMAIDHINAREDILPGYELRMVWNDTQVSTIKVQIIAYLPS